MNPAVPPFLGFAGFVGALLSANFLAAASANPTAPPAPPNSGAAQPTATGYTIANLGTLGGNKTEVAAINTAGQIVGEFETPRGQTHAFVYAEGKMQDLGTLGGNFSIATAINASGSVVGFSETAEGEAHAFLHTDGKMRDLGALGGNLSYAQGINATSQIVGRYRAKDGQFHAFLYSEGAMRDLGSLGGKSSRAIGINDAGQIAGYNGDSSFNSVFLYSSGHMKDVGNLGYMRADVRGINAAGQIVGSVVNMSAGAFESHAFLYDGGGMRKLFTSSPFSEAAGINASGQIVGWIAAPDATGGSKPFAYLYHDGAIQNLEALITPAQLEATGLAKPPTDPGIRYFFRPTGINDRGQIIGETLDARGKSATFLLTPVEKK